MRKKGRVTSGAGGGGAEAHAEISSVVDEVRKSQGIVSHFGRFSFQIIFPQNIVFANQFEAHLLRLQVLYVPLQGFLLTKLQDSSLLRFATDNQNELLLREAETGEETDET